MAKKPHIARNLLGNRTVIQEYDGPSDPDSSAIAVGDFVTLSSNRIARVTGADPSPILGLALSHNSNAAREEAVDRSKILVAKLDTQTVLWMEGTRAPLTTDIGEDYGIVVDPDGGTHYVIDASDTTNVVFLVVDVDIEREAWFVVPLAADIQVA